MSQLRFTLLSTLVFSLFGCTTADLSAPRNQHPPSRAAASDDAIVWQAHPCSGTSGAPFRKYHHFAIDPNLGLVGQKGQSTDPIAISDRPSGGGAWASVEDFLNQKGILTYCGQTVNSTPQPERPEQTEHEPFQPFTAPINPVSTLYYQELQIQDVPSIENKIRIFNFLSRPHLQALNQSDRVVDVCPADLKPGEICLKQLKQDYTEARQRLFGDVDLRKNQAGEYELFDHYCQAWRGRADFSAVTNNPTEMPGPGQIVHVRLMNCEHSWPQSKFPAPKGTVENLREKTDLHHIFATDTDVNSKRSNYDFAEVTPKGALKMHCADGLVGQGAPLGRSTPDAKAKYFKPPEAFKGNVARALFYFSARYNAGMSAYQEAYLRKWNQEDPPDAQELDRNERVYRLSGVRNPFIDNPQLAESIPRYCRIVMTKSQQPTSNDCAKTTAPIK